MELLIATRNPDKCKEIKQILKNVSYKIIDLSQTNIPSDFDIPETGETFKANAILKAKGFGEKSQLLTFADDSGLIIDALDGQPGIHSARFAQGDFKTAMQKILKKLTGIPKEKRLAKFVSVLAIYNPQTRKIHTITGECHGWIDFKPKGSHGFGYDPIFLSKDLNKTFGEASLKEKNKISHRAKALAQLKQYLSQTKIK